MSAIQFLHKKSTLHGTRFFTFLCRCFERLQRETSRNPLVTYLLIFTLEAASISHFLTATIKFSCYCSNEIGLLCFLSLALALSACYPLNVDIEIKSKERIGFVFVRVAMRRNSRELEMQSFA